MRELEEVFKEAYGYDIPGTLDEMMNQAWDWAIEEIKKDIENFIINESKRKEFCIEISNMANYHYVLLRLSDYLNICNKKNEQGISFRLCPSKHKKEDTTRLVNIT